jgi:hypothetical protein
VKYTRIFLTLPFSWGRDPDETNFNVMPWKIVKYIEGGQPVWNLEELEELHFKRVREFVAYAKKRGIVTCLSLFDNWGIRSTFDKHPFNAKNNINSITAGKESWDAEKSDSPTKMFHAQYIFVDKLLWMLHNEGLIDSVIIEIGNENQESKAWHKKWVETIRFISSSFSTPVKISINTINDDVWSIDNQYSSIHGADQEKVLLKARSNIIMSDDGLDPDKRYTYDHIYYCAKAAIDQKGHFDHHDTRSDLKKASEAQPDEEILKAMKKARE